MLLWQHRVLPEVAPGDVIWGQRGEILAFVQASKSSPRLFFNRTCSFPESTQRCNAAAADPHPLLFPHTFPLSRAGGAGVTSDGRFPAVNADVRCQQRFRLLPPGPADLSSLADRSGKAPRFLSMICPTPIGVLVRRDSPSPVQGSCFKGLDENETQVK